MADSNSNSSPWWFKKYTRDVCTCAHNPDEEEKWRRDHGVTTNTGVAFALTRSRTHAHSCSPSPNTCMISAVITGTKNARNHFLEEANGHGVLICLDSHHCHNEVHKLPVLPPSGSGSETSSTGPTKLRLNVCRLQGGSCSCASVSGSPCSL